MSESRNKLIKFWQELKRRRVFGVVTTYAATAYIIIEVTNNLVGPLNLPAWIAKLVILLLGAGLPVVVILSWIFDFTSQGIKKTESLEEFEKVETQVKPVKRKLRLSYVLNAVLIIAVIVLAYPKIFKRDTLEKLRSSGERISVAVMPFLNMTNDTTWNVWLEGIQDLLVTFLSNTPEIKVRQTESTNNLIKDFTNYASITPDFASKISQKLDARIFIYGSIKQAGTRIRVNAQLIDSETEEVFKSFQIEGPSREEKIFEIIDSLSAEVNNFLLLSKLINEAPVNLQNMLTTTSSPEAYRYFIAGKNAFEKRDYPTARNNLLQAISIDSTFYYASSLLAWAYFNQGFIKDAKEWCLKLYRKRDMMSIQQKILTNFIYAYYFETPFEAIKYLRQLEELDNHSPSTYYHLGIAYNALFQYDKAIPEYEKALEIYDKWDTKPWWVFNYTFLGLAYHEAGYFKKEKKLYKKAEKDFPDDPDVFYRHAVLTLTEGDTVSANDYIEKYLSVLKNNSYPEAQIMADLGEIYFEADIPEKAEKYYRKALFLEPENPFRMNYLAWCLIEKELNINEGLDLINKALELNPDDHYSLDTKGWGLYKQGKYKEALIVLGKSWNLRPFYNHEVFLHLEAAKKAVAGQKNN